MNSPLGFELVDSISRYSKTDREKYNLKESSERSVSIYWENGGRLRKL